MSEKDRFKELYNELKDRTQTWANSKFFSERYDEMLTIYRKLKQENKELKERMELIDNG